MKLNSLLFNPHPIVRNISNNGKKLNNKVLQCKLRLLLIISSIIEYRYENEEEDKEEEEEKK